MTPKELAAALQVTYSTILRLRREGLIRGYKIRTQVRFVLEEVLEDLRRAEAQLPLRRISGTLHKSGGPRVPYTGGPQPNRSKTIILEEKDDE